jgi:hypothetical protein
MKQSELNRFAGISTAGNPVSANPLLRLHLKPAAAAKQMARRIYSLLPQERGAGNCSANCGGEADSTRRFCCCKWWTKDAE